MADAFLAVIACGLAVVILRAVFVGCDKPEPKPRKLTAVDRLKAEYIAGNIDVEELEARLPAAIRGVVLPYNIDCAMTSKPPATITDGTADYERIDVIGGGSFYVEL